MTLLQCVSNGVTAFLHQPIDMFSPKNCHAVSHLTTKGLFSHLACYSPSANIIYVIGVHNEPRMHHVKKNVWKLEKIWPNYTYFVLITCPFCRYKRTFKFYPFTLLWQQCFMEYPHEISNTEMCISVQNRTICFSKVGVSTDNLCIIDVCVVWLLCQMWNRNQPFTV